MLFLGIPVSCGDDESGGGGNKKKPEISRPTPIRSSLKQVSIGDSYTCAITSGEGAALCWGFWGVGRLGSGTSGNKDHPVPVVEGSTSGDPLTGIVDISSGSIFTCALTAEGNVKCWGYGSGGELGNKQWGASNIANHSVDVVGTDGNGLLSNIVQIDAGWNHACALTDAGEVVCWGDGRNGRLGNTTGEGTNYPNQVVTAEGRPLTGIVQVSAGSRHTCALTIGRNVLCWGDNGHGQLGDGSGTEQSHPVTVVNAQGEALSDIVEISTRGFFTCALTDTGQIWCWGEGDNGELGNNGTSHQNHPVMVISGRDSADALSDIVQISVGGEYACALNDEGKVLCWGKSGTRLGDGLTRAGDRPYPVHVATKANGDTLLTGVAQIRTGESHACGVLVEGGIVCWGSNAEGQLGNDDTESMDYSVTVVNGDNSTDSLAVNFWQRNYVCTGEEISCRWERDSFVSPILTDPTIYSDTDDTLDIDVHFVEEGEEVSLHLDSHCAGTPLASGTVGTGESSLSLTTRALTAKEHVIYVKVGELCSANRTRYTYTDGVERITGTVFSMDTTPTLTINDVVAGDTLALHKSDDCSDEAVGQIQASATTAEIVVNELENDGYHTFYLKHNEACYDYGSFQYDLFSYTGRIGRIGAKNAHSCAVTSAGGVSCWGNGGSGRLGNDATGNKNHTVNVVDADGSSGSLGSIVQVGAGQEHTCAVTSGGGVKCWGKGANGRLGNNATGDTDYPVDVVVNTGGDLLEEVVYVEGGEKHTCALLSNKKMICWGSNQYGQLGTNCYFDADNSTCGTNIHYPDTYVGQVSYANPSENILQISLGKNHSCALLNKGRLICWGLPNRGQLGITNPAAFEDLPRWVENGDGNGGALRGVVQVSAGDEHTCALTNEGKVLCWGRADSGQLGNDCDSGGTNNCANDQGLPAFVVDGNGSSNHLAGIVQVAAGKSHTCALTNTGEVLCWGDGDNGQLGNDCNNGGVNSCTTDKDHPVSVKDGDGSSTNLSGIVRIDVGGNHTCAVTSGGDVKCWGQGASGQLGNRATDDKDHPVTVNVASTGSTTLNVGTVENAHYVCYRGSGKCKLFQSE